MSRIASFLCKPVSEKRVTIRFFARRVLSKIPFVAIPARFRVSPLEDVALLWSYLPMAALPDRTLLEYWGDDRGELRFLWQFLDLGMTFFDVGAYHGIFSVVAAMKLAGRGQVVAFEPSPRERRRFELHVRMNGLRGVRLEPYAVSSGTGNITFFTVAAGPITMNSLKPPRTDCLLREINVDAVSLDEYVQQRRVTHLDVMKIDVEGGELEAFRGASQTLTSIRPIMICEVLDWVTEAWNYPAREIIHYLREFDYTWFDFNDDGKISPHVPRDKYPEIRNYLAVPQEKLSQVEPWYYS